MYRQRRVGKGGKIIKIFKYRTMVEDADELLEELLKDERYKIEWEEIQKFKDDKSEVDLPDYAVNLQRIFIVDEAHRGYKKDGCFLAVAYVTFLSPQQYAQDLSHSAR